MAQHPQRRALVVSLLVASWTPLVAAQSTTTTEKNKTTTATTITTTTTQEHYLTVTGTCDGKDGIYASQGVTVAGARYYFSASAAMYLYYDPACDGSVDRASRWIFDNDSPSTTASSNLDGDTICRYYGRIDSGRLNVPLGTQTWRFYCSGSWTDLAVTVRETTTTTAQAAYLQQTSGSCAKPITSMPECSSAAQALGLSDTSASSDGQSSVSYDPPFCYYEAGSLKFNSDGSNTGTCSSFDTCICQEVTCNNGYYTRRRTTTCDSCSSGSVRRRRAQTCSSCPSGYVPASSRDDCQTTTTTTRTSTWTISTTSDSTSTTSSTLSTTSTTTTYSMSSTSTSTTSTTTTSTSSFTSVSNTSTSTTSTAINSTSTTSSTLLTTSTTTTYSMSSTSTSTSSTTTTSSSSITSVTNTWTSTTSTTITTTSTTDTHSTSSTSTSITNSASSATSTTSTWTSSTSTSSTSSKSPSPTRIFHLPWLVENSSESREQRNNEARRVITEMGLVAEEAASVALQLAALATNSTKPIVMTKVTSMGVVTSAALSIQSAQAAGGAIIIVGSDDSGVAVSVPLSVLSQASQDGKPVALTIASMSLEAASKVVGATSGNKDENAPRPAGMPASIVLFDSDGHRLKGIKLHEPMMITLKMFEGNATAVPQCAFFDESRSMWSNEGVTTVDQPAASKTGTLTCETTHLTIFAAVIGELSSLAEDLPWLVENSSESREQRNNEARGVITEMGLIAEEAASVALHSPFFMHFFCFFVLPVW